MNNRGWGRDLPPNGSAPAVGVNRAPPGSGWGRRCFRLYKRAWRQQQRQRRTAEGALAPRPTHIRQKPANSPGRWSPRLVEQTKRVVVEVPKYPHRPETIRVNLIPRGVHTYVDVRVYLAGKPTRQGLVLHSDLVPAVLAGRQRALGVVWETLPRPEDRPPRQRQGETAVHLPPEWG